MTMNGPYGGKEIGPSNDHLPSYFSNVNVNVRNHLKSQSFLLSHYYTFETSKYLCININVKITRWLIIRKIDITTYYPTLLTKAGDPKRT